MNCCVYKTNLKDLPDVLKIIPTGNEQFPFTFWSIHMYRQAHGNLIFCGVYDGIHSWLTTCLLAGWSRPTRCSSLHRSQVYPHHSSLTLASSSSRRLQLLGAQSDDVRSEPTRRYARWFRVTMLSPNVLLGKKALAQLVFGILHWKTERSYSETEQIESG